MKKTYYKKDEDMITPAEFARRFRISPKTVHDAARRSTSVSYSLTDGTRKYISWKEWGQTYLERSPIKFRNCKETGYYEPVADPNTPRGVAFKEGKLSNRKRTDLTPEEPTDSLSQSEIDRIQNKNPLSGYEQSRKDQEIYKAAKMKLEYEKAANEVIDMSTINILLSNIAVSVQKSMLALSDRIAPLVASSQDTFTCHKIIDEEVRHALKSAFDVPQFMELIRDVDKEEKEEKKKPVVTKKPAPKRKR